MTTALIESTAGTALIFGMPGGLEWLVIGGVVLVLFGASAIPRFARSIGKAKKEFERGLDEGSRGSTEADGEPGQIEPPAPLAEEPTQGRQRAKAKKR